MIGRGIAKGLAALTLVGLAACAQQEEPMAPEPMAAPAPSWQTIDPSQLVGRTLYLDGATITLGPDGRFSGSGKGNIPTGRYAIQNDQICFQTVAGESVLPSGCYTPAALGGRGRLTGPGGQIEFDI